MLTSRRCEDNTRTKVLCEIHELPPSALLTPKQAAAYLNTTTGVMANWRSLRRGPRYHGADDFVRYRLRDLDDWVSQRASEIPISPSTFTDEREQKAG